MFATTTVDMVTTNNSNDTCDVISPSVRCRNGAVVTLRRRKKRKIVQTTNNVRNEQTISDHKVRSSTTNSNPLTSSHQLTSRLSNRSLPSEVESHQQSGNMDKWPSRFRTNSRPFWDQSLQTRSIYKQLPSRDVTSAVTSPTRHYQQQNLSHLPKINNPACMTSQRPRTVSGCRDATHPSSPSECRYPRGQQRPSCVTSSYQALLLRHQQLVATSLLKRQQQRHNSLMTSSCAQQQERVTSLMMQNAKVKCEKWLNTSCL